MAHCKSEVGWSSNHILECSVHNRDGLRMSNCDQNGNADPPMVSIPLSDVPWSGTMAEVMGVAPEAASLSTAFSTKKSIHSSTNLMITLTKPTIIKVIYYTTLQIYSLNRLKRKIMNHQLTKQKTTTHNTDNKKRWFSFQCLPGVLKSSLSPNLRLLKNERLEGYVSKQITFN